MLRGLLIVAKYGFKKPTTIRYPEEKRTLPIVSRGRHYLTKWPDGKERCVGCELCAIVCPAQAIYVKPAANTKDDQHSHGERYAKDFQINMTRCIYCGLCEEACPTGAIVLSNEYELSGYTREELIFTKKSSPNSTPASQDATPIGRYKLCLQTGL